MVRTKRLKLLDYYACQKKIGKCSLKGLESTRHESTRVKKVKCNVKIK